LAWIVAAALFITKLDISGSTLVLDFICCETSAE
jgi:hypothetical protein